MATPSMFSEGHRKVGYTYHNMLMRELPIMAELLPELFILPLVRHTQHYIP
jgi:hypothetical protein